MQGLNFELDRDTKETFSFAVKQPHGGSLIFVPGDGKIEILRIPNFSMVQCHQFWRMYRQLQIFLIHSGWLLLENQVLYLINRNS